MVDGAEVESPDFKWGIIRGKGGKKKDVQFYGSFIYDGVEYALYDSVYLYKEDEPEPYIGKLIKIWETADKSKKIKVIWFFRPCEIFNFLGDDQPAENELFLASGEGVGLANINPLEAVAGKCNVVCTSSDSRNPQPSEEELQMSDFIFYRTFDVGNCKILDKIDDKIAGIEVKFLFNRADCQKSSSVDKLDSNRNGVGEKAVAGDKMTISSQQNMSKELKTSGSSSIDNTYKEDSLARHTSSLVEKPISSADAGSDERIKSKEGQETTYGKSSSQSKVEENTIQKPSLVRQKSSIGEKVSSGGSQSADMERIDDKRGATLPLNTTLKSKLEYENSGGKVAKVLGSQVNVEKRVKSNKASSELNNRPSKRAKLDSSASLNDELTNNDTRKLCCDSNGNNAKAIGPTIITEDKHKQTTVKDSHGIVKGPSKNAKDDVKLDKPDGGQLTKASSAQLSNVKSITGNHLIEVTRRPTVDRSKWFKELPWEDRMRAAHEQGTLVLLENLDPSYSSTEVEDIIWHAFKENCSAKMVQRIGMSSPYIGQAYAIFKTKEAAEMAMKKLDEGCLMLSNGRPLIGRIPTSGFAGKQSIFFGHLAIDKLKHQMQREMREAVSTSHCSQPNTVEYDMAMEWCLLQDRFDRSWKELYEQQGEETRKLKARLKSK